MNSPAREAMVDRDIVRRGIRHPRVLNAMRRVDRSRFVPDMLRDRAYDDTALAIGHGQTISQPYVVALMAEAAYVTAEDRVLEVGTGSGYGAAILGELAARVDTIERIPELAAQASERLRHAGYRNVHCHQGDGTLGDERHAPFDVIISTAAGPGIPMSWQEQLSIGGRVVMPIGDRAGTQRLVRLTRRTENTYDEEDLGAVRFVPLIGEHAWPNEGERAVPGQSALSALIASHAVRLPDPWRGEFGVAFDRFADADVILLGESTHGTSEFYRARASITRRLVEAHGFSIIAVEADWPDASVINRYILGQEPRGEPAVPFARFPSWMWRNEEMSELVRWLRAYNATVPSARRVQFRGLDIYSLHASIDEVLRYLDAHDAQAAAEARQRYDCLAPWQGSPARYGSAVQQGAHVACEAQVVAQLESLLSRRMQATGTDDAGLFEATENARVIAAAERYYRAVYRASAESWNLRDTHMFETLDRLRRALPPPAKAVVWAHNSHVGDARATAMAHERGEHNLGQLCRQRYGERCVAIGFGTHQGHVAAASAWGAELEIKPLAPSIAESHEHHMHGTGIGRFLLDLRPGQNPALKTALDEDRPERFVGVIYHPETERRSHYMRARLASQFDAWVWLDRTGPVQALPAVEGQGEDDLFPFAV
ncbi:protein-L-isoaspartate(D-aspartate) O-methyltransferase [Dyella jiangningensis]|uniref:protein-L-isoaspartate(D-aspartate) O-methyltransferase n=1 Tax=Dyella sp. AtDHG13 TaxID=1938897 RepID=UPI00088CD88A|nr:protein-L-isoaspartate(D-aspartate) O-methyltransferase [Dyella sp. AtDHG13]PXV55838.1 protein-L-isoaspartate(D-aspartate) O-methyltransferase [Dyella sp. AtDHG13]SDK54534.1 protein-L-isoaspartate(D-aspartate) O-methyltransferase [Dyella jiangningensis]